MLGLICAFVCPLHSTLFLLTFVMSALGAHSYQNALGRIGLWSINSPELTALWSTLEAYPLVPWLGLHNSVINGGLVCGIALFLPTWVLSYLMLQAFAPESLIVAGAVVRSYRPIAVDEQEDEDSFVEVESLDIDGALKNAVSEHSIVIEVDDDEQHNPFSDEERTKIAAHLGDEENIDAADLQGAVNRLQDLVDGNRDDLSTDEVVHRAAEMTNAVDDLLDSLDDFENSQDQDETSSVTSTPPESQPDSDRKIHRLRANVAEDNETVIQLVHTGDKDESNSVDSPVMGQAANTTPLNSTLLPEQRGPTVVLPDREMLRSMQVDKPGQFLDETRVVSADTGHDEALRHLLRHLKEIRDRVDEHTDQ